MSAVPARLAAITGAISGRAELAPFTETTAIDRRRKESN